MATSIRQPAAEVTMGQWVEAAPFRAHLRHLMAVGDMSSDVVAVLADISPGCAHRLLHGRGGRALRRISPVVAGKLLQVTPRVVSKARMRQVAAAPTTLWLRRLRAAGWSDSRLSDVLGLRHPDLLELLAGTAVTCSQLTHLRTAATASALFTAGDEATSLYAAA